MFGKGDAGMKIGFMMGMGNGGRARIEEHLEEIKCAETLGLNQAWMAQVFSTDAITLLTVAGRETSTIRLGTAVVPSYPRHPTSLAMQALTASAASGGRFDLGLGLSHKLVMEEKFGIPYVNHTRHMREYLQVLMPLVKLEYCDFDGEEYAVHLKTKVPGAEPVPVLVAALGPKMLNIAGTLADGTSTWMVGPRTLEEHTIPIISKAAADAGRPAPQIVAGMPIVLTRDTDASYEALSQLMKAYRHIPSYSKMLDREGADQPWDIALVGDESELRIRLKQLQDIGVTDLNAFCMPSDEGALTRTMAFLASVKSEFQH